MFAQINIKKRLFFLALILLPLLTINMERTPGRVSWYARPFTLTANILQNTLFSTFYGMGQLADTYFKLVEVKKQNFQLLKQSKELAVELQVIQDLREENQRLRSLLKFQQRSKMKLLPAQVIGKDSQKNRNSLFINQGHYQGVRPGMAVLHPEGVIGQIYLTQGWTSQVLLITDRYSVVDSMVQRTRARGSVEGSSDPHLCHLRYIEKGENLSSRDLVVTSGLDNVFPKGFPIAHIKTIEKGKSPISLDITLEPLVNIRKVEEVFVVLNAAHESFEFLSKRKPPQKVPSQKEENLSNSSR